MAEFCVIQKFKASHGKTLETKEEKEFRIEVVIEGPIDSDSEYAGNVDFFQVMRDLSLILNPLRRKYLRPILNEAGLKTSVLEAMGIFFYRKLKEKNDYPIKSVKVWENDFLSATVFPEDCGIAKKEKIKKNDKKDRNDKNDRMIR